MSDQNQLTQACPFDDCDNQIIIPQDAEEADIIVCRTENNGQTLGCNRNTEITTINRDPNNNITSVELQTLEIDEDWGE